MTTFMLESAAPITGRRINKVDIDVQRGLALMGLGNLDHRLTVFGYGTTEEMVPGSLYKLGQIDLGDGKTASPEETIAARIRRTYTKDDLVIVTLGIDDQSVTSAELSEHIEQSGLGQLESGQTFNVDAFRTSGEVKVQFFRKKDDGQLEDKTETAMARLGLRSVTAVAQDRSSHRLYMAGIGNEAKPVIIEIDAKTISRLGAGFTQDDVTQVISLEAFGGKKVSVLAELNDGKTVYLSANGIADLQKAWNNGQHVSYSALAWNSATEEMLGVNGDSESGAIIDVIDVTTGQKSDMRYELPAGTWLIAVTQSGQPVIATMNGYAWGFLQ
ncbi:MAG: hypothetical protein HYY51_00150 [Candidatus Magasanikbacteria bacterium]|nr:hypothetical protein [Candidatus Magasanikbacteria bacterium]